MAKRVSLTLQQLEESAGAELLSICKSITEDGCLSDPEINDLKSWLQNNASSELPSVQFLQEIVTRILEDNIVTKEEAAELLRGIEKVLSPSDRKVAVAARKQVEAKERERNEPIESFDFMIAGAGRDEYTDIIEKKIHEGDEIYVDREPTNKYDKNAVRILAEGKYHIGYVPRRDAVQVAQLLDSGLKYKAYVKKILGYNRPIPVVVLDLFGQDAIVEGLHAAGTAPPQSGCGCASCLTTSIVVAITILIFGLLSSTSSKTTSPTSQAASTTSTARHH